MITLKEIVSQLEQLQKELRASYEKELTAQRQALEYISEKNQAASRVDGFIAGLIIGFAAASAVVIVIYALR